MLELGYMAKHIAECPEWLDHPTVCDIYAVSNCVSRNFCDYINHWKHNGFWLFDSPAIIRDIARIESLSLSETSLLYYRGHPRQFDVSIDGWVEYAPEPSFDLNVSVPLEKFLIGYDVVSYSLQTSPECSPLSCNYIATEHSVNEHCLIEKIDYAIHLLENGSFDNAEPGPYRIIAVYTVPWQSAR